MVTQMYLLLKELQNTRCVKNGNLDFVGLIQ